jgi:hypothetical protein
LVFERRKRKMNGAEGGYRIELDPNNPTGAGGVGIHEGGGAGVAHEGGGAVTKKAFTRVSEETTKFKIGINYIATKASKDGKIQIGMPIRIENESGYGTRGPYYVLFGMNRVGRVQGHERNDVRYFHNLTELAKTLEGVEAIPDIKWARERIDEMQLKIADLEKRYHLKDGEKKC